MFLKKLMLSCLVFSLFCDVFSGLCFAQYESMVRQQIEIERSVANMHKSKHNQKKAEPKQNTKYHHLMANMANRIKEKGGQVVPEEAYPNTAMAYNARVEQYNALNPTPEEMKQDITAVLNSDIPMYLNNYDPAAHTASNVKIPKPKVNIESKAKPKNIKPIVTQNSANPASIYSEPQNEIYENKQSAKAKTALVDEKIIQGESLKQQQENIYPVVEQDIANSKDIVMQGNAVGNEDDGGGVLVTGLEVLSEYASDIFGPIGEWAGTVFKIGSETAKTGIKNTKAFEKNTAQGEGKGLHNVGSVKHLEGFVKDKGKESLKNHNYSYGYELSFEDEQGNVESVDFDMQGATKIKLNGEEYYVFTSTDGSVSNALIKVEEEPFWKFWKDDKVKIYKADIEADIENGNYDIKNAKLIGEDVLN